MSIVIEIRRSGEPFEAAELERAAARRALLFATERLIWTLPNATDPITLNITPNEIWTDDPRSTGSGELSFLKDFAKELRAEVYCEGEPLTDDSAVAHQQPGAPVNTILAALAVVLTAPFLLVWAIIRLPWVLWQIKRGTK